ncbi:MAG TPA: DUF3152 domain-containing protein [Acidimicrobiales bacterium]|nr:DUF3152 domain-containing protein [Acidimicrobiales bacterium]
MRRRGRWPAVAGLAAGLALAACGDQGGREATAPAHRRPAETTTAARPAATSSSSPVPAPTPTSAPAAAPATMGRVPARAGPTAAHTTTAATAVASPPAIVEVAFRIERRVEDAATEGFEAEVEATLLDPRGWTRAGFRLVRRDDAPYLVVLAEGPEVDRLCLPHDTYGEYSCQRSETVALNAERWREATPQWTGDLHTYRQMLVNHEFGHLLGQPHPKPQCPRPGQPAPLMAQQSTELDGCLPNPWPLEEEIAAAARHDRPLAPL